MPKRAASPRAVHAAPVATRPAAATLPFSIDRGFLARCLLLLAVTVLAYWPALNGSLLWDDVGHVTKPELQSIGGLWRIWLDLGATQQYYPLLHSAFWIEHRIWGDHVLGYHLVNVALHATSAILIAVLMRRWRLRGAWLAAWVFALHPVNVESVAWISEQKNTLSTVFCLLAALTYQAFDERRSRPGYVVASLLFLCALASKTTTATLPAALLVVMWWRRGTLSWRRDALPLVPWLVAGVGAGLFTAWVEHNVIGASGNGFDLNLFERVLLAGCVAWFYLLHIVWPTGLMFTYPRWTIDATSAWQYLPSLGAVLSFTWLWLRRRADRGALASALVFVGVLVPALGFVNVYPFLFSFVADHFQYLASISVVVALAHAATGVSSERVARPVSFAVAVLLVGTLGVLTWRQSGMYRDVVTLYRETIARNPASWMAHGNLGIELAKEPATLPQAIAEFEAAVKIRPEYVEGRRNLALAYWHAERLDDAIREYEAALRLEPAYALDHANLGRLLATRPARAAEAAGHLQAAVRLDPALEEAHYALGGLLADVRPLDAIAYYQAAVRLKPDHAEAHLNLANLLVGQPGRVNEAIAEYRAAIRVRPDYAEAYFNLGSVLMDLPGRTSEAVAALEIAVRLRPQYAEAQSNLGLALSDVPGRLPDAIAHLEAALAINPSLQPTRQLLGELRRRTR